MWIVQMDTEDFWRKHSVTPCRDFPSFKMGKATAD
jgi:hypothetical protein